MELSDRLLQVAQCIPKGSIVADIGTDHAYLPIYLVTERIASKVIAMDLRKGPLKKAAANITASKDKRAAQKIELRCSDGLDRLKPGEAEVIIVAGMGGKLTERILTDGQDKYNEKTSFVFSPQSGVAHFRRFLAANGFHTESERILFVDGKFYVILCCGGPKNEIKPLGEVHYSSVEEYAVDRYGALLIHQKDSILRELVRRDQVKYNRIRQTVSESDSIYKEHRLAAVQFELEMIEYVLERMQK